jgi:hypothetical protein
MCLKLVLQVLVVYTTPIRSHFTLMRQKKNLVAQMFCQTIVEATQCCLKLWNQRHVGGTTSNDPPWMHWSSCRWLCRNIKTHFFFFSFVGWDYNMMCYFMLRICNWRYAWNLHKLLFACYTITNLVPFGGYGLKLVLQIKQIQSHYVFFFLS